MKFNKLSLQRVQSHKKTDIEFDSGLNVITGSSDSGKSVIIRSFKLLAENRPSVTALISHGSKSLKISASDGIDTLERFKTSSKNGYNVNGNPFKAIGTGVPSDVANVLNLSSINIQEQKDHFFLLNDSPGQVSKKLNAVAGLSEMDESLTIIDQDIRKLNTTIGIWEESIEENQNKVSALAWTDKALEKIEKIEKLRSMRQSISVERDKIEKIAWHLESLREEEQELLPEDFFKKVKAILDLIEKRKKVMSTFNQITRRAERLKELREEEASLKIIDTTQLAKDIANFKKLAQEKEKIAVIYDKILFNKKLAAQIGREIKKNEKELSKFKVCPTCKRLME